MGNSHEKVSKKQTDKASTSSTTDAIVVQETKEEKATRLLNENELSQHRLRSFNHEVALYTSINLYFEEVYCELNQQRIENEASDDAIKQNDQLKKENSSKDDKSQPSWMEGMSAAEQLVIGNQNKFKNRSNLSYFTNDTFDSWTWPILIENLIEKESNWRNIYFRGIFHLKQLFKHQDMIKNDSNKKVENDEKEKEKEEMEMKERKWIGLSENEFLNYIWIYIGYLHNYCHECDFTLGDSSIMFDFLNNLSLMFKAIMIGYDYEQYKYNKICEHYIKPILLNINQDLLKNRAQIMYAQKIKAKKDSQFQLHYKTYEKIRFRMDAVRQSLQQNGIKITKI